MLTNAFKQRLSPPPIRDVGWEFIAFGVKQAHACLFGGFMLGMMLLTTLWYPLDRLHRYDFLFIAAVGFQVFLLTMRLETGREALVIVLFHVLATGMELFKTSPAIGSWQYPETYRIGIANVPLFTGFLYSAVGSYLARAWRLFEFRFTGYPHRALTVWLVAAIYLNFFSHHFIVDLRWGLLLAIAVLYRRCWIEFRVLDHYRRMPLLLGFFLVTLFIWLAENIGSYAGVWLYPHQLEQWQPVAFAKMSSWYLLMLLSFVLVSLVNPNADGSVRDQPRTKMSASPAIRPARAGEY